MPRRCCRAPAPVRPASGPGSPSVSKATTNVRVIHVSPTPFGSGGLLGGGERYPLELARALATHVDCELITFGPFPRRLREPGGLRLRVLRPLAYLRGHPAHPLAPGLLSAL